MEKCVQSNAAWVKCYVCKKRVKTCERKKPRHGDYRCPRHPEGAQVRGKIWVCSDKCLGKYLETPRRKKNKK